MTFRVIQVMAGAQKGGAETAFVDTVLALHEQGIVQHVLTRPNDSRNARLMDAGITVTTLPFGGIFDWMTTARMKKIIASFKPDIIQTWMSRAARFIPASSEKRADPYVVISRLGGYYNLKYYKNTDYFMPITPDIGSYLMSKGIAPDCIQQINNFAEVEAPRTYFNRADYGVPPDATLLVSLGRLHTSKAFDILMQAMQKVPDTYAFIAGAGPDEEALKNFASQLGLADRIIFMGWIDDRAALLAAGDICVFPSRYEPFGTVFVQAWAAGIPLITSLSDGPRQYVREGEDALTFQIDDVDALAGQITRLKDDKAMQERLVTAGKNRYLNEFTKEKTMASYMDFYARVVRPRTEESRKTA